MINQNTLIFRLPLIIFTCGLLQSCGSSTANAESPCPTGFFNSADVVLLDSISEEKITTATVVLSGFVFDETTQQPINQEFQASYSNHSELYHFPYTQGAPDISVDGLTIYAIDTNYQSHVAKPQVTNIGCTTLEYQIYMCPNGTACR